MNPSTNHQELNQPVVYGYPVVALATYGRGTTSLLTTSARQPPWNANNSRAESFPASVNHELTVHSKTGLKRLTAITSFLLAVVLFVMFGVLVPSLETHKKPEFRVDSVIVSPLNISSNSQLTADWTIKMHLRNPNKLTPLLYNDFAVAVFYNKTAFLSKTRASGSSFRQGPRNQTTVMATAEAFLQGLSGSVPAEIAEDLRHGAVNFDLKLHFKMGFFSSPFLLVASGDYDVNLSCEDVRVGFQSTVSQGTMLEGPYQCSDDRFKRLR